MSVTVILGLQWGDEGKGKVVDYFSKNFNVVARATGGNNAGHTVVIGDKKHKLHLIPSGLFQGNKIGILGNGMVIDLEVLCSELDYLTNSSKVFVSGQAHVIMPWHKHLDAFREDAKGIDKIGTTKRGIGPAYESKAERSTAIRGFDLQSRERFEQRVLHVYSILQPWFDSIGFTQSKEQVVADLELFRQRIAPLIVNSSDLLFEYLQKGELVLVEGAQGTLLDYDHGTFPFVTSSNPSIGGVLTGTGINHSQIKRVVGVVKAYTTRVGAGPFPTKLENSEGEHLQVKGIEFGTTTGRKRDCGWLDGVALQYAVKLNGVSEIALTKLDVLSGLETVKIATGYELNEKKLASFPTDTQLLQQVKPIYTELPGWSEELTNNWENLPLNALKYVEKIEELTKVPVTLVSIGPERNQTITR